MNLKEKIVDFVISMTGGLPQGEGHHNPVKVVTPVVDIKFPQV